MIPVILKGDTAKGIMLTLADGYTYGGCSLDFEYQGAARQFTDLVAGGALTVDFTADETAGFLCGTHHATMAIVNAAGEVAMLPWAKIKVTDSPTEVRAAQITIDPATLEVEDATAADSLGTVKAKLNAVLAFLRGTSAALAICLLPFCGFGGGVDSAVLNDIPGTASVVTNVDLSGKRDFGDLKFPQLVTNVVAGVTTNATWSFSNNHGWTNGVDYPKFTIRASTDDDYPYMTWHGESTAAFRWTFKERENSSYIIDEWTSVELVFSGSTATGSFYRGDADFGGDGLVVTITGYLTYATNWVYCVQMVTNHIAIAEDTSAEIEAARRAVEGEIDYSTGNQALVDTINTTAPSPGNYAAVSNAAMIAKTNSDINSAALRGDVLLLGVSGGTGIVVTAGHNVEIGTGRTTLATGYAKTIELSAEAQASLTKADTALQPSALGGYYTKGETIGKANTLKELHVDSVAGIVWQNVYSNGWVYIKAYTNDTSIVTQE